MKLVHILGLLLVLTCGTVLSATIHVPTDQPTIQAGIDAAVTGDTVLVADGTYSGEGNIGIDFEGKLIVLMSENGPEATIIDCQQAGRAFYFHSGEDSTASISGFTIKNGVPPDGYFTGGGIQCESSSPTIIDCVFEGNVVISYTCGVSGGAIYASQSTMVITNCTFRKNLVRDYFDLTGYDALGGAIAVSQSIIDVDSCLFTENRAAYGGAVSGFENSTVLLSNCTFYGNIGAGSAVNLGYFTGPNMSSALAENCIMAYGALAVHCFYSTNSVQLICCNIFGNVGGDWVGNIAGQIDINGNISANPLFCAVGVGDFFLSSNSACLPENNSCNELMGAFSVGCYSTYRVWYVASDGSGDAPTIQAALDSATHGDTILLSDGVYAGAGNYDLNFKGKNLVLRSENGAESTIIVCDSLGRGLYFGGAEDSTAVVEDVTITMGLEEFGGGIYCGALTSPTIRRCRFEQNSASYRGGAASIATNASPMFVECAFVENRSLDKGGAIFSERSSTPTFYSCRFESNLAITGGAASLGGSSIMDACVFHGNSATVGGGALDVYGSGDVVTMQNCTVTGNSAVSGGGVYLFYGSVSLVHTLICFSIQGQAVYDAAHGSAIATCCNVFGNAGGDWVGALSGQQDQNGNFSGNPYFCDTGSGDLHVLPWSPCAPDNNSCGVLIGALPTGCYCVIRGDINHDGSQTIEITDLVYLVDFMFTGGVVPPSMNEADVNADGATDIADLVYLVDYMFNAGPAPVPCP